MNQNEAVKIILGSLKRADDMVMALDFIKAAMLLDCAENNASVDDHVMTDVEAKAIIGRLLNKALVILHDYEMPKLLQSFNADEDAKLHDAHTKLLMKLIDHEFYQMEEEHENDN